MDESNSTHLFGYHRWRQAATEDVGEPPPVLWPPPPLPSPLLPPRDPFYAGGDAAGQGESGGESGDDDDGGGGGGSGRDYSCFQKGHIAVVAGPSRPEHSRDAEPARVHARPVARKYAWMPHSQPSASDAVPSAFFIAAARVEEMCPTGGATRRTTSEVATQTSPLEMEAKTETTKGGCGDGGGSGATAGNASTTTTRGRRIFRLPSLLMACFRCGAVGPAPVSPPDSVDPPPKVSSLAPPSPRPAPPCPVPLLSPGDDLESVPKISPLVAAGDHQTPLSKRELRRAAARAMVEAAEATARASKVEYNSAAHWAQFLDELLVEEEFERETAAQNRCWNCLRGLAVRSPPSTPRPTSPASLPRTPPGQRPPPTSTTTEAAATRRRPPSLRRRCQCARMGLPCPHAPATAAAYPPYPPRRPSPPRIHMV